MGAETFLCSATGPTLKEAFRKAVEHAQYEYGHGGYTGTIAEKGSVVEFKVPEGVNPISLAQAAIGESDEDFSAHAALLERVTAAVDDKWGAAGAIEVKRAETLPEGHKRWVFFGWASS